MNLADLWKSKGILIDTNLLVLLVIGELYEGQIQKDNLTLAYTVDDYDLLLRVVNHPQCVLVVTPHILTEASNLLKKTSYKGVHAWYCLKRIVEYMKEESVTSLDTMNEFSASYLKFGLTDAVIHSLAKSNYTVLTQDLPLCMYLQNLGYKALKFNNLRTGNLLR